MMGDDNKMERDELQITWEREAKRTGAAMSLNQHVLRTLIGQRALSSVRWLSWLEMCFDVVAILWLGSFAFDHLSERRFLVPALLLFVGALALLQVRIRSIVDAAPSNYAEPILALQKRLERIQLRETTTTRAVFALCWLAWTPLQVVLAEAMGIDVYSFGAPYLLANVAFGVIAGLVTGWLFCVSGNGRIARALDGTTAREARAALAAIASFERAAKQ